MPYAELVLNSCSASKKILGKKNLEITNFNF